MSVVFRVRLSSGMMPSGDGAFFAPLSGRAFGSTLYWGDGSKGNILTQRGLGVWEHS